jgi:hypothetical protein
MRRIADFITHVPVEVEPSDDGIGITLTAAGVRVPLDPPCRVYERLYVKIDNALNAKAIERGSNMPVALDPTVWLHRCRRCKAPFIALPKMRLCSDACRAAARQDAALRSKAKRVGRADDERLSRSGSRRFVCRQCGERSTAFRLTKQFCTVRCRVAAHRGALAADPEPMTVEELDREIANAQSTLGALRIVGTNDPVVMRKLAERVMALQAERAKLARKCGGLPQHPPDNERKPKP